MSAAADTIECRVFPPDQTAELSTPAGLKPGRANVAAAADSITDGRSEHAAPTKVGVWEVGAIINDRYTLERRLGGGSMGEVFLASDRLLKKHVALKVLRGDMAKSRATVRRFLREVALAHSVTHPNVVRIYDTGEADGLPYMSMEYLQGQTLEQLIEVSKQREAEAGALGDISDPPMTLREIREISYEILSGLAAAHDAGIVHRDLKPANVMLTHRGAIVMDFGVAGFDSPTPGVRPNPAEARSLVRTEAGTIFGSPAYMAPELWEGAPATIQSDLYSFGVMLYQMLTGRLPIEAPNAKAYLVKLREEKPLPVRTLRKDTPWTLALLVARCMNHDPDDRPPTADAAANLVSPFAGRWRWAIAGILVLLIVGVASFAWRGAEDRRYQDLGLPDSVAAADLDAFVRSFDVGDYEAASRQLERLEVRAPDSAAVIYWRATLEHLLGNEDERWSRCSVAGYDPNTAGEAWAGDERWREQAMSACAASYTLSTELLALLDPAKSSGLSDSWLPIAVTESLIPRLEATRGPSAQLEQEVEHVMRRLETPHDFREGPTLAIRWQLARFDLLVSLGMVDDARNHLDTLLDTHPEAPIVLARAAHFYALSGELERAKLWADRVAPYDPRPRMRLLLDAGRLREAAALLDRYAMTPGEQPLAKSMLDTWCGYAYRFELQVPPPRCGAMSRGLVHNMWMGARKDRVDGWAMNALEKIIVTQQADQNHGECLTRSVNGSVVTHTTPPFETYLRQLDVYGALCFSGKEPGPNPRLARELADELVAAAPGDPWALLVDATVDDAQGLTSATEKRRKVVDRWVGADDLPLVRAVRELVGDVPASEPEPAPAPGPATELGLMTPAEGTGGETGGGETGDAETGDDEGETDAETETEAATETG